MEESSMLATGAVGRGLQYPGCGRSMRSHCKEIHGVSILIPLEADISRGRLHHQPSAYITMEWRGQQHARGAVESTASGATAATIAYIIMDDRPDEEE